MISDVESDVETQTNKSLLHDSPKELSYNCNHPPPPYQASLIPHTSFLYVIMTEELVIREIRIDEAAGRGDSDSRMTSFELLCLLNSNQLKYQFKVFET